MNTRIGAAIALVAAVFALASCQIWGSEESKAELLEKSLLLTHYAELETDHVLGQAKAAMPDAALGFAFPAAGSTYTAKRTSYPEAGQSTTFTVSVQDANAQIYRIAAATSYGGWDGAVREATNEVYYVKDGNANGLYDDTTTDPIVNAAGEPAPRYRESFSTTYMIKIGKGTPFRATRYETIAADYTSGLRYAAFPIDGSLDFQAAYEPPVAASGSLWSSLVTYEEEIPARALGLDALFGSSVATFHMTGRRYYAETGPANDRVCSSLTFEEVLESALPGARLLSTIVTRTSYPLLNGLPGAKDVVSQSIIYYADSSQSTLGKQNSQAAVLGE